MLRLEKSLESCFCWLTEVWYSGSCCFILAICDRKTSHLLIILSSWWDYMITWNVIDFESLRACLKSQDSRKSRELETLCSQMSISHFIWSRECGLNFFAFYSRIHNFLLGPFTRIALLISRGFLATSLWWDLTKIQSLFVWFTDVNLSGRNDSPEHPLHSFPVL